MSPYVLVSDPIHSVQIKENADNNDVKQNLNVDPDEKS